MSLGAGCGPAPSVEPDPSASRATPSIAERKTRWPDATSAAPTSDPATLDLDVGRVDRRWTATMLEFASDGAAIVYSSGTGGADVESAPDLWLYDPSRDEAGVIWRNPDRGRSIVRVAGDLGTWAFVDMTMSGDPGWDLRVLSDRMLAGGAREPVVLATYTGGDGVPTLVPSVAVSESRVVWTEFASSADGPVSRLMHAAAPGWSREVLEARPLRAGEFWLPSVRGTTLAYTVLTYSADRTTDTHEIYLRDLSEAEAEPQRLDTTGLASAPMVVDGAVIWKETEAGMSMFNWGKLVRYDLTTGRTEPVSMAPQEWVNAPSAGSRFIAASGSDSFVFTVHDMERRRSETLARYATGSGENVLRPHVAGDLLVWLHATVDGPADAAPPELRYAFLPVAGADRGR
jgi:hypothetical protein